MIEGTGSENQSFVTVFVPTFNGERYLRATLEGVLTQTLPEGWELDLLVIDSGSTDATLEILSGFGSRLRLHRIENSAFSHGGTRDEAARMARGQFVVYLTQDATPLHQRWLINMIEPFFLSDKVGCVYGAQRPRRDAPVTIKREVTQRFPRTSQTIVVDRARSLVDGALECPVDTFLSDVNSAARRQLLVGDVPFRRVPFAEDQALAQDMQEHGYLKAYAPNGAVWHSNDFGVREFFARKRDEYLGQARSTDSALADSELSLLLGWIKPTLRDWRHLFVDAEYGPSEKTRQFGKAPLYNIAAKIARYGAARRFAREQGR